MRSPFNNSGDRHRRSLLHDRRRGTAAAAGTVRPCIGSAKLGGVPPCDPAKNQWTIRNASAWRGPNALVFSSRVGESN